ncbi:MAG: type II secretion system F family protein [Candidatus Riflebacteria bacterium]|nr:type II secretion system F family protein [Candidatus Riflebacteria bacterium]
MRANAFREQDLLNFTRELAFSTTGGLDVRAAVRTIEEQSTREAVRLVARRLSMSLSTQPVLSEALADQPDVFDPLFVGVVRAGERSGKLADSLDRLARLLDQGSLTRGALWRALKYPTLCTGVAGAVVLALLALVIPQFASIYQSMNVELPAATRALLWSSTAVVEGWPLMLLASIGLWQLTVRCARFAGVRRAAGAAVTSMPIVGSVARHGTAARTYGSIHTCLASGSSILEALSLVESSPHTAAAHRDLTLARRAIERGDSLAGALRGCRTLPRGDVALLSVGAEAGNLEGMLDLLNRVHLAALEAAVGRCTALAEPVVIVGMGLVIGSIVLAVFMPNVRFINNVG